jgi:hypothetical protein
VAHATGNWQHSLSSVTQNQDHWKQVWHPPCKGEPAKNFYTELGWLTQLHSDMGLAWKGQFVNQQIIILPRKTKTYETQSGPQAHFWPLGPGNLYRLPPPHSPHLISTAQDKIPHQQSLINSASLTFISQRQDLSQQIDINVSLHFIKCTLCTIILNKSWGSYSVICVIL